MDDRTLLHRYNTARGWALVRLSILQEMHADRVSNPALPPLHLEYVARELGLIIAGLRDVPTIPPPSPPESEGK